MTNEERLQYAKDNYPVGTKYKCPINKEVYEIIGNNIVVDYNGYEQLSDGYIFYHGKWAEIISKPETKDGKMTHERAIKILENNTITSGLDEIEFDEALDYAINQLKQCEVFDEPRDMKTRDFIGQRWEKSKIIARINNLYLEHDGDVFITHMNATPIKPNPLSFTDFCHSKLKMHIQDFHDQTVDSAADKYTEYLNQFKEK